MSQLSNIIGQFVRALLTSGSCQFPRLPCWIACRCPEEISDPVSCWEAKALAPPPFHKGRGLKPQCLQCSTLWEQCPGKGKPLHWSCQPELMPISINPHIIAYFSSVKRMHTRTSITFNLTPVLYTYAEAIEMPSPSLYTYIMVYTCAVRGLEWIAQTHMLHSMVMHCI